MYKVVTKRFLNEAETICLFEIEAPLVARHAKAGQFVIFRLDEQGERVPVSVAGWDREKGTVTVMVQAAGRTTKMLHTVEQGDYITDFVGPLGEPSHTEGVRRAAVIGGGLGVAIAYPQAKALHQAGAQVDLIVGFRSQGLIILQEELTAASDDLTIMTDDGSNGHKGFVTQALAETQYDMVVAIGPMPMMKAVCDLTRPYGVKTIVSMNPIMIDGTGMCGGCRITVGGETKFACVDGPDFDGHQVDWDEAMARSRMYRAEEAQAREKGHVCRLTGGVRS